VHHKKWHTSFGPMDFVVESDAIAVEIHAAPLG
jgi:hypothetical protein